MRIRILTWNVWCENTNTREIVDFLIGENFDVICLQEVPSQMLEELAPIKSYTLIQARDAIQRSGFKMYPNYLVILVKETMVIARTASFKFKKRRRGNFLARVFGLDRTLLAWVLGWKEGIEYQHVDIRVSDRSSDSYNSILRIFNVHLSSAVGPRTRRRQFLEVLDNFDKDKLNVFCGDLNVFILKKWWGFLYRIALFDSWNELWEREHEKFRIIIEKHALHSACDGCVTQQQAGCQLDYILSSRGITAVKERVFEIIHWSDHNPMFVEIET